MSHRQHGCEASRRFLDLSDVSFARRFERHNSVTLVTSYATRDFLVDGSGRIRVQQLDRVPIRRTQAVDANERRHDVATLHYG